MNKKLKRMIATVSAVVTCAVSMASVSAGAIYIYNTVGINQYTVSFTWDGKKYSVWQEMQDYYSGCENCKFFISEDGEIDVTFGKSDIALFGDEIAYWYFNGYMLRNPEDVIVLEKYLSDNNIAYKKEDVNTHIWITLTDYNCTSDEYFQLAKKIKEDTGLVQGIVSPASATIIEATDIEIALPEPTLIGDANEDGVVNISDAVLIMQSIFNPTEYQLSIQGMANADVVDNDGITLLDALRIQEMSAGL
ncbi:MAG: dockerin type I repeat-containing protein [Ruminococcus sp.]|nr:dockerin type I repeat-containing protein [Ruminococcus sp.]